MLASSAFPLPAGLAPTARIVGGQTAGPHAFPYVLSLRDRGSHTCGAALVAPQWAVTAAHCFPDHPVASLFSVDVHRHDIGVAASADHRCSEAVQLQTIHNHPSFSKSTLYADIALLRLARSNDRTSTSNYD